MAQTSSLPVRLDEDSSFAIAAYTLDTGKERTTNVYYVLNQVLRARKTDQISFRAWQGFLFFLMYDSICIMLLLIQTDIT